MSGKWKFAIVVVVLFMLLGGVMLYRANRFDGPREQTIRVPDKGAAVPGAIERNSAGGAVNSQGLSGGRGGLPPGAPSDVKVPAEAVTSPRPVGTLPQQVEPESHKAGTPLPQKEVVAPERPDRSKTVAPTSRDLAPTSRDLAPMNRDVAPHSAGQPKEAPVQVKGSGKGTAVDVGGRSHGGGGTEKEAGGSKVHKPSAKKLDVYRKRGAQKVPASAQRMVKGAKKKGASSKKRIIVEEREKIKELDSDEYLDDNDLKAKAKKGKPAQRETLKKSEEIEEGGEEESESVVDQNEDDVREEFALPKEKPAAPAPAVKKKPPPQLIKGRNVTVKGYLPEDGVYSDENGQGGSDIAPSSKTKPKETAEPKSDAASPDVVSPESENNE